MSKSLFFGVMGTPYQSELTTSLLRIVNAALVKKCPVTVWCCGYATSLTQTNAARDPDIFDASPERAERYKPICDVIGHMVEASDKQLRWYVCDYCMRERGCTQQASYAQVKIPFSFYEYMNQADLAVIMGVKS